MRKNLSEEGECPMKRYLTLLLALVAALTLAACGGSDAEETQPAEPETGSVRYLNYRPETDAAWQKLAAVYTARTGVAVKVVSPENGTYADTLTAKMSEDEAPTLFNCADSQTLKDWSDHMLDLTDTAFAGELTDESLNLYDDSGALKAAGFSRESYGLIVNVDLLNAAGYELSDITNFETLKAAADDIHQRSRRLGFDAFTPAGLEASSAWRFSAHLANLPLYYEFRDNGVTKQPAAITGAYLDRYHAIWDLYITDSSVSAGTLAITTNEEATALFTEGNAVFHQQGSWAYDDLTEAGMTNLAMIPIYCGAAGEEKAGLCTGTENRWAVNSQAAETDIQATLDFLYWVVTSEEGTQMLADTFGAAPFQSAKPTENPFCASADKMAADGRYSIPWDFCHIPNPEAWKATVATALTAYAADPTDANWTAVEKTFVEGWAYEYTLVNG